MAGNPTPTPSPAAPPETPPPAGGPNSGNPPAPEPKAPEAQPPTEDPTNPEWLKKRLERADKKGYERVLRELGVENAEAVKAALAELDELKKSKLTESERLQKERDDALKLAQDREARLKELETVNAMKEHQRQLEEAARAAGIRNDALEFVTYKLDQYVKADPVLAAMDVRDPVLFKSFFEGLKTGSPTLFDTASAPPANLGPNNPPGPTPPASGAPTPTKTALEMSPQEYSQHIESKYGIKRQGMMR